MNGMRKSDKPIVPAKFPNKAAQAAAEVMEGRGLTTGSTIGQNAPWTQSRIGAHSALDRVRQRAKTDREGQFTALLHHVDLDRLRTAFFVLKKDAAAGSDGITW
jgi:RNA-directed DNA polymerase